MPTIAPQLQEDIFGTKTFTITLTVRNPTNTADAPTLGVLYTPITTNLTVTGNNTHNLVLVGKQVDCNAALQELVFYPAADETDDGGVKYIQTDDNATGTPGSNPKSGFMQFLNRDTHNEFALASGIVYNEDATTVVYVGAVTDVRGTTFPTTTYRITLLMPVAAGTIGAPWLNPVAGSYTFSGTKQECNAALAAVPIVAALNYVSPFTLGYQQQQVTDNIDQGSGTVSATVGTLNTEFNIVSSFGYIVDTINTKNLGLILDQVNPASTQYTISLALGSSQGKIDTEGAWFDNGGGTYTYTGTKTACNTRLAAVKYIPPADSVATMVMTYSQTKVSGNVNQGSKAITMAATQSSTNYSITNLNVYRNYYTNLGASITDIRPDNINANLRYDWSLQTVGPDISLSKITTDAGFTAAIPSPSPSGASVSISRDSSKVVMSTLGGGSNVVNIYSINQGGTSLVPYGSFTRRDPNIQTGCFSVISGDGNYIILDTPSNIEVWEDAGNGESYIWRDTLVSAGAAQPAVTHDAGLLLIGNKVYRMNTANHKYTLIATLGYTATGTSAISGDGMFISLAGTDNVVRFLHNPTPSSSSTWTLIGSANTVFPVRHSVAKDRGAFMVKGTVYEYGNNGAFIASYFFTPSMSNTDVSESTIISPNGNFKFGTKLVTGSNDMIHIAQGSSERSAQPAKVQGTMHAVSDDYLVMINGSSYNTAYFMKYTTFTVDQTGTTMSITNSTKTQVNDYLKNLHIRNVTPGTTSQQLKLNQTQITDNSVQASDVILNCTIRTI